MPKAKLTAGWYKCVNAKLAPDLEEGATYLAYRDASGIWVASRAYDPCRFEVVSEE